jgi:excisionase family DNA binding protein
MHMKADANIDDTEGRRKAVARVGPPLPTPRNSVAALSGLESAFLAFLQSKTSNASVPVDRRIFLTMAESSEFSGLPVAFLRRLIASGKLRALKTGSGWRVSRTDIEKAAVKLMDPPDELSDRELAEMDIARRRRRGLTVNSQNL